MSRFVTKTFDINKLRRLRARCTDLTKWLTVWLTIWLSVCALQEALTVG